MKTYTLILISALAFTGCDKPAESPTSTPAEAAAPGAEAKAVGAAPELGAATAKPAEAKAAAATAKATAKAAAPAAGDIPAPADVAATPADATTTDSGLAFKILTAGTGTEKPGAEDTVKVHYTGWTTDGKMFDSSVKRGKPTEFRLNGVIKGWTEGVGLMVTGEKRRFWIPGSLAYGDTPRRPGAPSGKLVFDVELISITKAPSAEETAKLFTEFGAKLKTVSETVCACKDMACAQPAMMTMRGIRPPSRPSPEQMKEIQPYMQKIQECMQKFRPPTAGATGKPAAPPAGKKPGAPATK